VTAAAAAAAAACTLVCDAGLSTWQCRMTHNINRVQCYIPVAPFRKLAAHEDDDDHCNSV